MAKFMAFIHGVPFLEIEAESIQEFIPDGGFDTISKSVSSEFTEYYILQKDYSIETNSGMKIFLMKGIAIASLPMEAIMVLTGDA